MSLSAVNVTHANDGRSESVSVPHLVWSSCWECALRIPRECD